MAITIPRGTLHLARTIMLWNGDAARASARPELFGRGDLNDARARLRRRLRRHLRGARHRAREARRCASADGRRRVRCAGISRTGRGRPAHAAAHRTAGALDERPAGHARRRAGAAARKRPSRSSLRARSTMCGRWRVTFASGAGRVVDGARCPPGGVLRDRDVEHAVQRMAARAAWPTCR